MYNDETPNSAYTVFLQSKKTEEESKRKDKYRNSMTDAAKAVIEQNGSCKVNFKSYKNKIECYTNK